jgi:hypothetical protein
VGRPLVVVGCMMNVAAMLMLFSFADFWLTFVHISSQTGTIQYQNTLGRNEDIATHD